MRAHNLDQQEQGTQKERILNAKSMLVDSLENFLLQLSKITDNELKFAQIWINVLFSELAKDQKESTSPENFRNHALTLLCKDSFCSGTVVGSLVEQSYTAYQAIVKIMTILNEAKLGQCIFGADEAVEYLSEALDAILEKHIVSSEGEKKLHIITTLFEEYQNVEEFLDNSDDLDHKTEQEEKWEAYFHGNSKMATLFQIYSLYALKVLQQQQEQQQEQQEQQEQQQEQQQEEEFLKACTEYEEYLIKQITEEFEKNEIRVKRVSEEVTFPKEGENLKIVFTFRTEQEQQKFNDLQLKNPAVALNIEKYKAVRAVHNQLVSEKPLSQRVEEAKAVARKHQDVLKKEVDSVGMRFLRALEKFISIFNIFFSIAQNTESLFQAQDKKGCSLVQKITQQNNPRRRG